MSEYLVGAISAMVALKLTNTYGLNENMQISLNYLGGTIAFRRYIHSADNGRRYYATIYACIYNPIFSADKFGKLLLFP